MSQSIDQLIAAVLNDAKDRREAAGFAGEWSDRGATDLETQVRFYNYGRQGTIPPEWVKYQKEFDPEYNEYLRLKKKFG